MVYLQFKYSKDHSGYEKLGMGSPPKNKILFYLSHIICGNLFWQPQNANTVDIKCGERYFFNPGPLPFSLCSAQ